jgi:four helix bundle protein
MTPIRRFEDILAWQAARDMNDALAKVPLADQILADQLERCADSSMANIVEGYDSGSDAEFIRFLRMAKRSASEFQSHLYAAKDLHRISEAVFDSLYEHARKTKKLIGGFIRYLEKSLIAKPARPRHKRRSKSRRQRR